MPRKKKEIPQMPPDISMEEWEEMVAHKRARIEYDEQFLGLCEFFILADSVASVIDEQFSHLLSEQDRKILGALFTELSGIGYAMQDPEGYAGVWGKEESEYVEELVKWNKQKILPDSIVEAIARLGYYAMNSKDDFQNNNDIFSL